jgi:poly-gamma-glutamate synthesis protein (capsule biosynthesis protein)
MEPNATGRRRFLGRAGRLLLGGAAAAVAGRTGKMSEATQQSAAGERGMTLFLCGDVMTGRGIDQVLPHPGDPVLHEGYATSARDYVALAEKAHGPIPRPVGFAYVWGDALSEWTRVDPDLRIVNLETAVTTRDDWQRTKGIHYRMHPANVPCLTAAGIDCCVVANNHVLDWGYAGLADTLDTLRHAGLQTAGAGRDQAEAAAPARLSVPGKGRVLVFSFGVGSSGIPPDWGASSGLPGVNLLADFSDATLRRIAAQVKAVKRAGDVVVASIHWGGNWGYAVPAAHRDFAHALIDRCAVDVVHGHSSHHPLGIEVYRERPILYGCGDFLNDYEGIAGYTSYRSDLCLMYFLDVDPASGQLTRLRMTPMQMRRFRLNRASAQDTRWLCGVMDREGRRLGSRVEAGPDGGLELRW